VSDSYVVVRSVLPGTFNTETEKKSGPGHAWLEIHQPGVPTISIGYYPVVPAPTADGYVNTTDARGYQGSGFTSEQVTVTQEQIDAILDFSAVTDGVGNWTLLGGATTPGMNCATWSLEALRYANVDARISIGTLTPWFVPFLLSASNPDQLTTMEAEGWQIDPIANTDYTTARNWRPPHDPLVLDLDGDGIETVGITAGAPILFDHDGDGIKNATGWIKADDGLLVLDLNGNGSIDSGRELFGDNTLLPSGSTALQGYQALAQHDSNLDGRISSLDTLFNQLRIWQDANQDGISQSSELKTLAQAGIQSISVQAQQTPGDINLGNGNTMPFKSTYTKTDGSSGLSGGVELTGSLLLASNNFYRQFPSNPELTPIAKTLPQMQGSGWTRDLREAMSQTGDLSDEALALQQSVQALAQAGTREGQRAAMDGLLEAWANSTGKLPVSNGVNSAHLAMFKAVLQNGFWTTGVYEGFAIETTTARIDFRTTGLTQDESNTLLRKVQILETFNGQKFVQIPEANLIPGPVLVGSGNAVKIGEQVLTVNFSQAQAVLLDNSYEALKESVYAALALQTRLKPYLDSINLVIDDQGITFDTVPLLAKLDIAYAANAKNGLADAAELVRFSGGTLEEVGALDGTLGKLKAWAQAYATTGGTDAAAWLTDLKVQLAGAGKADLVGTVIDDVLFGDDAANSLNGREGDDVLMGEGGNDVLSGGDGEDILSGGIGSDVIYGNAGNDTLNGGAGNDTLNGGNYDYWSNVYSGLGNDTYQFGRGDGQDDIYDNDSTASNKDIIRFKAGVASADVQVSRVADSLVLKINGTTDQIRVLNYFGGDATNGWQVEEIRFTDESTVVWNVATIKSKALNGGTGDDTLVGYASADTMNGGAGADTISGLAGNDTVNGGEGGDSLYGNDGDDKLNGDADNDSLQGNAGNDTLNGGAGNDTLNGGNYDYWSNVYSGLGNDTYQFGRGDGQDDIYDNDSTASNKDIIRFKAGVASADVQVSRVADSLVLKINGTTDQIRVLNYFGGDATNGWQVEEIRFTDESTVVWNVATIKSKALNGGTGDDTLVGYASADTMNGGAGADTISGLAGNDTVNGGEGGDSLYGNDGDDKLNGDADNDSLQGNAGNDTLNGGAGNDTLNGGNYDYWSNVYSGLGNDTYQFGTGGGLDTIYDVDSTAGNSDKLSFLAGIAKNQLWLRKEGNSLEISIIGTTDKVTVNNWYSGAAYQIEQFTTASGSVLTSAKVDAMVNGMAAIPVVLTGQVTVAPEHQAALDALANAHWV
jgi:Ca2+-binding RTX toxin-like protein